MSGNCYKKNFVNKVVARIEFATPTQLFNSESISEVVAEIKKRFPISEQAKASQHEIKISEKGGIEPKITEFPEWIFNSLDRAKRLKVNQNFIEILLTKYDSEVDFRDDLILPISHLLKINPNLTIKRTGIRFINIFDFPINSFQDSQKYFSNSITGQFAGMEHFDKCTRAFMINEFVSDDIKLRVQTGFFNPDYPAIIKRNQFVIDIDAYIDFPHLIHNTEQYFNKLHDAIEVKFESLITDDMRKDILNG